MVVQENPGAVDISSSNETAGTGAGTPVTLAEGTTNSGAHLVNVDLTLGGNT